MVNCFLDIGSCASRAIISRGNQIYFARAIPVGGEHFNKATAHALRISMEEAKLLRIKLCHAQPALDEHREKTTVIQAPQPSTTSPSGELDNSFALLGAGLQAATRQAKESAELRAAVQAAGPVATPPTPVDPALGELAEQAKLVEQALAEPLHKMIEELDLCRRYYESTFPSHPVQRLIFVGGEARQRGLCQHIARQMGLAAQVGDPLVRMGRVSEIGIESGIDRRQPQPGWAVAIGLSLGPISVEQLKNSSSGAAGGSSRMGDTAAAPAPSAADAAETPAQV
jgi:cell division ATPase FtsA